MRDGASDALYAQLVHRPRAIPGTLEALKPLAMGARRMHARLTFEAAGQRSCRTLTGHRMEAIRCIRRQDIVRDRREASVAVLGWMP